nr:DegT/DnrJ/EryC1/StrS family aminotransferase [Bacillus sp. FJAT-29790]
MPDIDENEINEVVDSLRSGWLTTGPKTKRFEEEFSQFIGKSGSEAIAVNSATAGLHLVLEAIGVGPGDEVITTPYTFTATAEVIRYLGANPIFVDIDENTFNIDPLKIEQAITPRTKAIIPVHFAGLPCEMGEILAIARKYSIRVVEDAAHALPAVCNGSLIGSLESDATVFSFYATKTLATGEGGMIVTNNADIARRCKVMRLHGISRDVFNRYVSKTPSWYYEVIAPGFKYNMTDVAASLGIHQLKKIWTFKEKRTQIAAYYDEELADQPVILPPKPIAGDVHSWHLYVLRLGEPLTITRNEFIEKMAEKGIGCSVHFIPLHLHPFWRNEYKLKPSDYPRSLKIYEQAVSLPIYTKMTEMDQRRVMEAVREILEGNSK